MYRSFQALLLIGLSFFLIEKIYSGKLSWYINLRFAPLTLVGIVLLAAMGQAVFQQKRDSASDHDHEHASSANLWILLIPLLVGVLIPARPLDATAVGSKGVNTSAPLIASGSYAQQLELAPDERNILDWIRIFNFESDLSPYLGQTANVIGFVYHDERLPAGQFLISRFAIACCAADAFAVGIPVEWADAGALQENSWVQVKGTVQASELDEHKIPLIVATSVEITRPPDQPYLFP
jgi:uncharacterized repeat protein (TIGR03943 family)